MLTLPDETYMELFKNLISAAKDGLAPDLHGKNVFLEHEGKETHIHAMDFHHFDPEKYGSSVRMPTVRTMMGALHLSDDKYRLQTPQINALYLRLQERMADILAKADKDPEIRSLMGNQAFSDHLVKPNHYYDSWLDREHGRALKDITSLSVPQR